MASGEESIEIWTKDKGSTIWGRFDPRTNDLFIDWVNVSHYGQGIGTKLYGELLGQAGNVRRVRGVMAVDNKAALEFTGDILQTPRARILKKFGFNRHRYDPSSMIATAWRD